MIRGVWRSYHILRKGRQQSEKWYSSFGRSSQPFFLASNSLATLPAGVRYQVADAELARRRAVRAGRWSLKRMPPIAVSAKPKSSMVEPASGTALPPPPLGGGSDSPNNIDDGRDNPESSLICSNKSLRAGLFGPNRLANDENWLDATVNVGFELSKD